ncbi:hypothetical protein JX266_009108 [Neoarthrinium moseri]|nr:hypothetical protein JX266_009108 [Neoarthrinium moseri]
MKNAHSRRQSPESTEFNSCIDMELGTSKENTALLSFNVEPPQPNMQKRYSRLKILCLFQSLCLVLTLLTLTISKVWKLNDLECARQLSVYSPLLDEPNLIQHSEYDLPTYFNQPSPYRGPPTPEREALWEDLWHQGAINIPIDKLGAINKTQKEKEYKRTPIEAGGGYAAQVEVLHQLHCVGLLRSASYREEYTKIGLPFPGSQHGLDPAIARMHLDHCIEVLRLNIMCQGDVTPILIELDPKAPFGERADFTSYHKCRNFWDIHDWVKSHVAIP